MVCVIITIGEGLPWIEFGSPNTNERTARKTYANHLGETVEARNNEESHMSIAVNANSIFYNYVNEIKSFYVDEIESESEKYPIPNFIFDSLLKEALDGAMASAADEIVTYAQAKVPGKYDLGEFGGTLEIGEF